MLNVYMVQMNPHVGNIKANLEKHKMFYNQNTSGDVVVFPECSISGYPSDDLYLNQNYVKDCMDAVNELSTLTKNNKPMIVGSPWITNGKTYNAAVFLENGNIKKVIMKTHLPNYSEFDDKRWFTKQPVTNNIVTINEKNYGVVICEDGWFSDITSWLKTKNVEGIISINASPYKVNKPYGARMREMMNRYNETNLPLWYINCVGGQDELVFDGTSFVIDQKGIRSLNSWQEYAVLSNTLVTALTMNNDNMNRPWYELSNHPSKYESMWNATVLATKDYVQKNGFKKVVLGLSGGADSALVVAIATEALGKDNVKCIMMPTKFTGDLSLEIAQDIANKLGVEYHIVNIQDMYATYKEKFKTSFGDDSFGLAEENLQAQIRGDVLSWYSNKYGAMILSTGNRSEMLLGYATLYGDMRGGFNPIKDIYKTEVFEMLELCVGKFGYDRNVITRPPSAELSEDQKDTDSLPPYTELDPILLWISEQFLTTEQIVKLTKTMDGFVNLYDDDKINQLKRKIALTEYKRFQSCPGVNMRPVGLSKKDRRMPITNGYY